MKKPVKIILIILAVLLVLVILLGVFAYFGYKYLEREAIENIQANKLPLGSTYPDFTVETTDGTFTLSEALKEKEAALVIFWATWCGPCEHEFPFIQKVYEELGDKVAIIALSTESDDSMDVIREYQQSHGLTIPMGRDEGAKLFLLTGQTGIPTPTVIDRFGNMCYATAGSLPSEDAVRTLLNTYLGDGYTKSVLLEKLPG